VIVHGVVVAAGSGDRFGGDKVLALLGGMALWERARRDLLDGGVASVVLVGDMPGGVPGGPRRRDSVRAGVDALPDSATHVLIHDAARPLAGADLVRRVVARLGAGDCDGVVPGVPVRDTVKRIDGDRVMATEDRSALVAVQTPQGFAVDVLLAAHAASDEDATDDAALVEAAGGAVVVVPGDPRNLKVTYPEDLAVAEALL
jgi:2-C-methyl-D-erythritol 4-phosphate cytidylyltransferase